MTTRRNSLDSAPVEASLREAWPPEQWCDVTVLLAVSGGADSVALLRAMGVVRCGGAGRNCVAHFDHRLRGAVGAEDAQFVKRLCADRGFPCVLGAAGELALQPDRREEAARQARYAFLRKTAEQLGARFVVTAHTADDQAETVLHHIVRGTGLAGLAGMPKVRSLGPATSLMRPLLGVRRSELLQYLTGLGQDYRTDSSNADLGYTRNRIRLELLPHLAQTYNSRIVEALGRLGGLAGDIQQVIGQLAGDLAESCVSLRQADPLEIDVTKLAGVHRHLIREVLVELWRRQNWPRQSMGFVEWELLTELVLADEAREAVADREFPGGVLASRRGDLLQLTRRG